MLLRSTHGSSLPSADVHKQGQEAAELVAGRCTIMRGLSLGEERVFRMGCGAPCNSVVVTEQTGGQEG